MAKKIFGIILNIFIVIAVIIIVLIIYSIVQTKMLKKDYVNFCGYTVFQVATGSMAPTMSEKDIIIAKVLNEEQVKKLKIDDIIIYKEQNAMITHRIIEIDKDKITTRGDANNAADKPIDRNDVIGEVVHIIPDIGVWEKVFTTPEVYISVIVTITLWGITFLYKPEEKIIASGEKTNENKDNEKKE